ncbi:hypothetical protein AAVH_17594 [Aphelenchoides avenae]|nr:hypothetical protein AAVH_17594 [Aphelenchus avenae]
MSGLLPKRTRVYDNAAEFASDIPTYAHYLRMAGYYTALSGKMHFVGPDQLHGFEERLTTDIYPADFGWTPNYHKPEERIDWWYHNLSSVTEAGVAEITNQMEYDDEVAFFAMQKIHHLSRTSDSSTARQWCLTVSFTHPHDPYVARQKYWDLYEDCKHLLPEIEAIPYEKQDPHSQRILRSCDYQKFDIQEHHIKRARRGYFSNITYIDDKIGQILEVLKNTRQGDNTMIVFCSDHGDMLGERGLWFKMNFFEGSARVPLMMALPPSVGKSNGGCIKTPVSTLDLTATITDLMSQWAPLPTDLMEFAPRTDGKTLVPFLAGDRSYQRGPVYLEYAAEASDTPIVCIRRGEFKYIACMSHSSQLFDLEADPKELVNLVEKQEYKSKVEEFEKEVRENWDLRAYHDAVMESQDRRRVVYKALRNGSYYPWDYQPLQKASERYMRNHMDLNDVEESQRFPRGE